ncbi:hypothetical protein CQ10_40340 [Bradyrhizobium valentinum]|nr:hypothetical protein CQ10_40340 [Bradyrhizobium valentinum]
MLYLRADTQISRDRLPLFQVTRQIADQFALSSARAFQVLLQVFYSFAKWSGLLNIGVYLSSRRPASEQSSSA